ncbi:hypothetical protein F5Y17DRAFT_83647 [Xylariaceae sp. FL0594]|nr:hypothetical protein F5Y17DRAFT_83647 [Xylariaceae sp. FL0594]
MAPERSTGIIPATFQSVPSKGQPITYFPNIQSSTLTGEALGARKRSTSITRDITQGQAKRRRIQEEQTVIQALEPSTTGSSTNPKLVKCAEVYVAKVLRGLQKLGTSTPTDRILPDFMGNQLDLYRRNTRAKQGDQQLTKLLHRFADDHASVYWLADFLYRYLTYRNRLLDATYSETKDFDRERHLKEKEVICQVTSSVVNRLEPKWGICASLVYNALRETKYRGAKLLQVAKAELGVVVDLVVEMLCASTIQLKALETWQSSICNQKSTRRPTVYRVWG